VTDEDAAGSLLADGEPSTRAVFMVDPSAEAEHVAQLLRGMGCVVVDVPMSMLVARIAVQKPRVVIMDADVKEAADTVKTVRAMPGGTTIALVLLGQEKPPVEEGHASVGATSDAFFRRPIDPALVVQTVVAHAAEAPSHASESVAPTSAPTSSVPAKPPASARGWPWAAADRRSPVPAGIGSSGRQISARPPPNVGVRDTSVAVNAVISIQSPLSAELEMLLLDAEQRLTSQSLHEPAPPSPDEELEAVLPAELLAALDEPIEDDAEDFALDAGLSRGEAEAAVGSGAVPAPTNAGRALTPAPAISVGPMTIAGSAFAAAVVQQRAVAPTLAPPIRSLARNHGEQAISSDVVPGATGAASLPTTALTAGDAPRVLAEAIVSRQSGALSFESPGALRRVVVRDGDIVAAASSAEDETLLAFMTARGDVRGEHVKSLVGKIPPFGRHAGAALVGHGLLRQDQLWPALRAHSEWLISRVLALTSGTARLEPEPQGRLRSEPGVFGGSSGAEVLVELARRVVPSDEAIRLLGGWRASVASRSRSPCRSVTECPGRGRRGPTSSIHSSANKCSKESIWSSTWLQVWTRGPTG